MFSYWAVLNNIDTPLIHFSGAVPSIALTQEPAPTQGTGLRNGTHPLYQDF